jgi:hypothetical protein
MEIPLTSTKNYFKKIITARIVLFAKIQIKNIKREDYHFWQKD